MIENSLVGSGANTLQSSEYSRDERRRQNGLQSICKKVSKFFKMQKYIFFYLKM